MRNKIKCLGKSALVGIMFFSALIIMGDDLNGTMTELKFYGRKSIAAAVIAVSLFTYKHLNKS